MRNPRAQERVTSMMPQVGLNLIHDNPTIMSVAIMAIIVARVRLIKFSETVALTSSTIAV